MSLPPAEEPVRDSETRQPLRAALDLTDSLGTAQWASGLSRVADPLRYPVSQPAEPAAEQSPDNRTDPPH